MIDHQLTPSFDKAMKLGLAYHKKGKNVVWGDICGSQIYGLAIDLIQDFLEATLCNPDLAERLLRKL